MTFVLAVESQDTKSTSNKRKNRHIGLIEVKTVYQQTLSRK